MDSPASSPLAPARVLTDPRQRFEGYAWGLLAYTLFVILFGAVVRITGSGAGCGQHWPSCNGELLHLPQTLKTTIEYGHRATSGLSVLAIIGLLGGAFRFYPRRHLVRTAASVAFAMILVEALIGALLVKLRLVENDASYGRIVVLPLHLMSTALLTGALSFCAYFARERRRRRAPAPAAARALLLLAAVGILLVSATGAVTALGDTVYPVRASGLAARLLEDQGASAHVLQRMRGIHPFLAVAVATFVAYVAAVMPGYQRGPAIKRYALWLFGCVVVQVIAGLVNIWLSAPGPMQVVHLLLANLTWISLVLLAAALREGDVPENA